jgi:hypothetical protein
MDAWFTLGIFGLFAVSLAVGALVGARRDRAVDTDARRRLARVKGRRPERRPRG